MSALCNKKVGRKKRHTKSYLAFFEHWITRRLLGTFQRSIHSNLIVSRDPGLTPPSVNKPEPGFGDPKFILKLLGSNDCLCLKKTIFNEVVVLNTQGVCVQALDSLHATYMLAKCFHLT